MSPASLPVPVEFLLFALMLVGIALFHRHTLQVSLAGLAHNGLKKGLWDGATFIGRDR